MFCQRSSTYRMAMRLPFDASRKIVPCGGRGGGFRESERTGHGFTTHALVCVLTLAAKYLGRPIALPLLYTPLTSELKRSRAGGGCLTS